MAETTAMEALDGADDRVEEASQTTINFFTGVKNAINNGFNWVKDKFQGPTNETTEAIAESEDESEKIQVSEEDAEAIKYIVAESKEEKTERTASDKVGNAAVQIGSVVGGGILGNKIADKLSGGSKIWKAIGTVAGAIIVHKIAPKVAQEAKADFKATKENIAVKEKSGRFNDSKLAELGEFVKVGATNAFHKGQTETASTAAADVDL